MNKLLLGVVVVALVFLCNVKAEDLEVTSFSGNGQLVFDQIENAANYRVEWAPSPSGPWTNSWENLVNIVPAVAGSVTCSVAMCYRVVAELKDPPPVMVEIPGGTNSGDDPDFGAYSLTVARFYMDSTEVTNDEMVRVMQWAYNNGKLIVSSSSVQNYQGDQQELLDLDATDCRITWSGTSFGIKSLKGEGYPCVEVTWYGAAAYCNYRSEMEGKTPCYNLSNWSCNTTGYGYRLPTSDEWEYAARGGIGSRRFPWGDTITHSNANYFSSSDYSYDVSPTRGYHPDFDDGGEPYTSPVAYFSDNVYGLYDMAGNVEEWCNDDEESNRFIRGGSWNLNAFFPRCGFANWFLPYNSNNNFGFRAVCR